MQTSPGTTECNHSYYTGNSFSVSHSAQHLHNGTPATPAQPPASVQEVDAPASSAVISSSLLSCSAISSQVTVDPTRYGAGGDMPLAEAITQLSFLDFLQRCGVSIAPLQPSRPPASISLRDVTVQTTPPCDVSHQVSTQTSVQQDMLSCDVAVQTSFYGAHTLSLNAAAQTTSPSTLSRHVSTQMGSRPVSSFSVDTSVQTPFRCVVQHDAATQLPLTEFFIGCIYSNSPLDRQNLFVSLLHQCRVHLFYLSHRLDSHSQSLLLRLLLIRTCSPTLAALLAIPSSRLSVPLMGTHPIRTASSAKRSANTALAGTPQLDWLQSSYRCRPLLQTKGSDSSYGQFWATQVRRTSAPLPQLTAISCTINFAFPFFSGIQARRAEILPTSSLPPVVGSMQLSFRKPATMSRTSLITSERTPTTWTLLSCSTRTPFSVTPQSLR